MSLTSTPTRAMLRTVSGRTVNLLDPQPAGIAIGDVAHGLARICRFAGQIEPWWSVADHALLCRDLMIDVGYPELALEALHHDSAEAYLGDVITPLKRELGETYRRITHGVDRAIGVAFDVDDARFGDDVVRDVDRAALHIEARALGYTEPLDDPPPGWIAVDRPRELHSLGENAKDAFIAAHHLELSRRSRT